PAYQQALRFDAAVNDEAIEDLQKALALYPGVPDVYYSLGFLLEADGRRQEAREAYRDFVERAEGADEAVLADARARLAALEAPLPPMEIVGEARVTLGARGPEAAPYHPGDEVHPVFELSTPGDELPRRVQVAAELRPAGEAGDPLVAAELALDLPPGAGLPGRGRVAAELRPAGEAGDPLVAAELALDLPPGAVGFVVDGLAIALPEDLPAGTYEMKVNAWGGEGQEAEATVAFDVAG